MRVNLGIALGCTAILGVATYVFVQVGGSLNLVGALTVAFWTLIALGVMIRDTFGPLGSAADAYQSFLLSRPTASENPAQSVQPALTNELVTDLDPGFGPATGLPAHTSES